MDEGGIERGYRMQVWLIVSGSATLLFIVLLVGMMFQSFLATVGFASAAASARDVRSELEKGTATHETVSRHTYRACVSDAISQVTGTALSVTMVFCYIPAGTKGRERDATPSHPHVVSKNKKRIKKKTSLS